MGLDPVSLAVIAIGGGLLGGGLATPQILAGVEQRQAGKRQARRETILAGQQVGMERAQQRRLAGTQEAGFGAAGVIGGTPLLVQAASVFESLKQQEFIRAGGAARAATLREQGRAAFLGSVAGGIGTVGSTLITTTGIVRSA